MIELSDAYASLKISFQNKEVITLDGDTYILGWDDETWEDIQEFLQEAGANKYDIASFYEFLYL